MKILLPILFFFVGLSSIYGQQTKASVVPKFKILLSENRYFETKDIPGNKPFMLVYFAPDCDHCTVLIDDIINKIRQFDKAFILLVTFKSPAEVNVFAKRYNISQFSNIKVGTEGTLYVLRNFYKLEKTPFVAVYNKQGKLAASFRNDMSANEILEILKKL